jgi:Peptidase A4 family
MLSKLLRRFSILVVVALAMTAVFAQTSPKLTNAASVSNPPESSSEMTAKPPFWGGPALHAPGGRVSDGTANSYNWDGYVVTGTDFTSAKGSWIVPTGTCTKSPNAYASIWLGIDGWSDGTVEQTGTIVFCNKTTASYYAWYEFYPAATVVISTVPVKPGDKMSAQISYKNSEFTLEISDETTGKAFSVTKAVSGADRTSAEWIAEAPSVVTGITNLADFTKVEFGDDYTDIKGTNDATDSTHTGPISAFGTSVLKVTQVDFLDYTESAPSALSTDGTSFTSTWVEYN